MTVEIDVISLRNIVRQIEDYWEVGDLIEKWIQDPEVDTPEPAAKINGELYWPNDENVVERFKELVNIYRWLKAKDAYENYENLQIKFPEIVNIVRRMGKNTIFQNTRVYKNNRGNSIKDGDLRNAELEASIDFVKKIARNCNVAIPSDVLKELRETAEEARRLVDKER